MMHRAGPAFHATAQHPLSPTGVAALLILAFVIDFFAIFPAWLQIRLTFICVTVGVRQGFAGGPLYQWTVEKATGIVQIALDQAKGSYIAGAVPLTIVGIGVGILSVWSLGFMLPNKAFLSKKAGRLVSFSWKETGVRKMSTQVWVMAIVLGLLSDLPMGWMGTITKTAMNVYSFIGSPLPALAFGVH